MPSLIPAELGACDRQGMSRGIEAAKSRVLMRRAMAEPLLEAVLANQRRGQQAGDIGRRLLASCDEVEAAVDEVRRSSLATHYLDLDGVEAAWAGLKDGLTPAIDDQAGRRLMPGLGVRLFLPAVR
jgi:hypothetical protein